MAESPAPGWYEDPADATNLRYWDGAAWTKEVQPRYAPPPSSAFPPPPPSVAATPPPSTVPPPNYLAQAIVTTVLCCLPLGVVAIVKAARVSSLWQAGDHHAARAASADARRWAWIAFGGGAVQVVGGILLAVVLFAAGGLDDTGAEAACSIDARTLRTAEEAYYSAQGRYTSEEQLVPEYINESSSLHNIVVEPGGQSFRVVVADAQCGTVGDDVTRN